MGEPTYRKRWLLGVSGKLERKLRVIITRDRGKWCYRYKRPHSSTYVLLAPVDRVPVETVLREVKRDATLSDLY